MAILKEAATNPKYKSDTDQGKAINLYKTILDTIGRNKLGITPLKPYLKKIDAVKHKRLTSLINRNGTLRRIGFLQTLVQMLKQ
jgi:endothelin-converting enzyme/putative endopeptidase